MARARAAWLALAALAALAVIAGAQEPQAPGADAAVAAASYDAAPAEPTAVPASTTGDLGQPDDLTAADSAPPMPPPVLDGGAPADDGTPVKVKFARGTPKELRGSAVKARVAADKAAVRAALANPAAAFTAHAARLRAEAAQLRAAGQALPPNIAALAAAEAQGEGSPALARYRAAFASALVEIESLNAESGDSLAYGITPVAHLPKDEFRALYLSGKKDAALQTGGASTLRASAPYSCKAATTWAGSKYASVPLITNVDWRTSTPPTVTPVKDQGQCGSCVVFANNAALEAAFILKYGGSGYTPANTDLSEQDHMECLAGDQCAGANGYEYIDRAFCKGVTWEASAPYTGRDTNKCPSVTRYMAGITGYSFVKGTINDLRRALQHNVVAIGVAADTNGFMYYKSGVFPCGSKGGLNHEVSLVAYNNAVSVKVGRRTQTWKVFTIKNSWGTGWGEQGFVRARADCTGGGSLGIYSDAYLTVPLRD
ncbi:MAG: hypothetical protein J3K34DRAFT_403123 [Monoraphidium minutum]|nr:MAG: hypothetical protein J3K34DRAFT_403123 [Monoraphidium minutum]